MVPVLDLNSRRLAVWTLVLAHWSIRLTVAELVAKTWRVEEGWVVFIASRLMVVVAYISVPEIIHLKGSPPLPPVEVLYLLPWASTRSPETIM